MRKPIIAGNWKMHGSEAFTQELISAITKESYSQVTRIVFPASPYLITAKALLSQSEVALGAQNAEYREQGAYTGEVAMDMLSECGCDYVLVGHSERRQHYGETDEICALKVIAAQQQALLPVLCVGELLQERQQKQTLTVIEKQLAAVINHELVDVSKLIIAYEPVWAIGTGQTATPDQAQEVHAFIRQLVTSWKGEVAKQLSILYGGSVKPDNATDLLNQMDIDGALVGGASLKASAFNAIAQAAQSHMENQS